MAIDRDLVKQSDDDVRIFWEFSQLKNGAHMGGDRTAWLPQMLQT